MTILAQLLHHPLPPLTEYFQTLELSPGLGKEQAVLSHCTVVTLETELILTMGRSGVH